MDSWHAETVRRDARCKHENWGYVQMLIWDQGNDGHVEASIICFISVTLLLNLLCFLHRNDADFLSRSASAQRLAISEALPLSTTP